MPRAIAHAFYHSVVLADGATELGGAESKQNQRHHQEGQLNCNGTFLFAS
jgi:hypothetical protein